MVGGRWETGEGRLVANPAAGGCCGGIQGVACTVFCSVCCCRTGDIDLMLLAVVVVAGVLLKGPCHDAGMSGECEGVNASIPESFIRIKMRRERFCFSYWKFISVQRSFELYKIRLLLCTIGRIS